MKKRLRKKLEKKRRAVVFDIETTGFYDTAADQYFMSFGTMHHLGHVIHNVV